jgi:hypothetical protein
MTDYEVNVAYILGAAFAIAVLVGFIRSFYPKSEVSDDTAWGEASRYRRVRNEEAK